MLPIGSLEATVVEDELEYLTERALHELRAAMMSFEVRVRSVHIQMLDAYTLRLQELKSTDGAARN